MRFNLEIEGGGKVGGRGGGGDKKINNLVGNYFLMGYKKLFEVNFWFF